MLTSLQISINYKIRPQKKLVFMCQPFKIPHASRQWDTVQAPRGQVHVVNGSDLPKTLGGKP